LLRGKETLGLPNRGTDHDELADSGGEGKVGDTGGRIRAAWGGGKRIFVGRGARRILKLIG